ncbi:MAG TPA: hypothetical protein VE860_17790, partial [Chthoniobacterales bacterium]|nr:hypothetical protein [Chthoniobacterales bacterium]
GNLIEMMFRLALALIAQLVPPGRGRLCHAGVGTHCFVARNQASWLSVGIRVGLGGVGRNPCGESDGSTEVQDSGGNQRFRRWVT